MIPRIPNKMLIIGATFIALVGCQVVKYGNHRVINAQKIGKQPDLKRSSGVKYLHHLVLGDFGTGNEFQRLVAKRMAAFAKNDPISFVLTVGDNFYSSGVHGVDDPKWKTRFEDMYNAPSLAVPFWATLGNHDHRMDVRRQVEYTTLKGCKCRCSSNARCRCQNRDATSCWAMPQRYYQFTKRIDQHSVVHFIALDTTAFAYRRKAARWKQQLRWLELQLKKPPKAVRWTVVYGHHPIHSGGRHGDNALLKTLLDPILQTYKVDLYLAGHDHDLQLIRPKPFRGVHYVVSGAGGKSRDVTWRSDTLFAATNFGFVSLRFSRNDALIRFVTRNGRVAFAHKLLKYHK